MVQALEPSRPVHDHWQEIDPENDITWEPRSGDTFTGASGGANVGPTSGAENAAMMELIHLFLFIMKLHLFEYMAVRSNHYAYEEWVVTKDRKDKDRNVSKCPILSPEFLNEGETPPANARHRADNAWTKFRFTANYQIAWIGIAILVGAYSDGMNNRCIRNVYHKPPYGHSIPFIQNTMTERAFIFCRQNLHFSNNSLLKKHGDVGYDALFNVRYV